MEGILPIDVKASFSERAVCFAAAIDTELQFESLNTFAMIDEWSHLAFQLREVLSELAVAANQPDHAAVLRTVYLQFNDLMIVRQNDPVDFLSALSCYVHAAREAISPLPPTEVIRCRFLNPECYSELVVDSVRQLCQSRSRDRATIWTIARRSVLRSLAAWVADSSVVSRPRVGDSLKSLRTFVERQQGQECDDSLWGRHGYSRLLEWLDCIQSAAVANGH